jgi:hypothetical protein
VLARRSLRLEVVLGVVADRPAAGGRSASRLAEEVRLLRGEPGPRVGPGAEDFGMAPTVRGAITSPEATARKLVDRPERPLGHAATLAGRSAVVCRDHRWLGARPLSTRASSVARSRRTYLPILT